MMPWSSHHPFLRLATLATFESTVWVVQSMKVKYWYTGKNSSPGQSQGMLGLFFLFLLFPLPLMDEERQQHSSFFVLRHCTNKYEGIITPWCAEGVLLSSLAFVRWHSLQLKDHEIAMALCTTTTLETAFHDKEGRWSHRHWYLLVETECVISMALFYGNWAGHRSN